MTSFESQIQTIIDKMHVIFHDATGSNDRVEYMRENNIAGDINWSFSLSADDIINKKIPPRVAGCTGRAKLFCHLAAACDILCYVVATANYEDWLRAQAGHPNIINGHQIIAVEMDGKLRAFSPGREKLEWISGDVVPGRFISAVRNKPQNLITAVVPGDEFAKCDTYQKLRNLYTSGSMDCSDFIITPGEAFVV
ncbi:MAG: hypothetical protein K2M34_02185 [Alphaproteobacteria bacterium]|nr:hypothetical protein [Alphaproteobacteria bacterium]